MATIAGITKVIESENIQAALVRRYMLSQATKLATKLHKLYPQQFTEEALNQELLVLEAYLSKCRININTNEAVLAKKRTDAQPKPASKMELSDDERCCARVWDIKCIKQVDANGQYINYGSRCRRRHVGEGKYCAIHMKKNSHGDYQDTHVPQHLKDHFEKAVKKYGPACIVRC